MVTTVPTDDAGRRSRYGLLSFILALVALDGVTFLGLTSFIANFNPPDWLRIAVMAPMPFAVIGSVAFGVAGLHGARRGLALAGLVLSAMVVVAFVVMIVLGG